MVRWQPATIALGAIVVAGRLWEYSDLTAEGVAIDRNAFTPAFHTLTGFHGLHVLIGLVALAVVARLAFAVTSAAGEAGGRSRASRSTGTSWTRSGRSSSRSSTCGRWCEER